MRRTDSWRACSGFGLGLQFGVVFFDEHPNLVGHRQQLPPLLFVERDGKPSEPVHGHAALFADLQADAATALALETLVLRLEAFELRFEVFFRHYCLCGDFVTVRSLTV